MSRRVMLVIAVILSLGVLGALGYLVYRSFFGGTGTITVWTIQGNEQAIKKVADIYHQKNPAYNVRIIPVPEQVYEFKALYSLATQKGTAAYPAPDVLIMPNEWMALHRNKLIAAPDNALDNGIKAYSRERAKGETPPPAPKGGRNNSEIIQQDYAPAVATDLLSDGKVWGVPINMDTLALYYDKTKIATPPKTWQEVVDQVRKYTLRSGNNVTRSTIALGDHTSVAHGLDILSILMLQNGAQMVDDKGQVATFHTSRTGATPPGAKALDFYTSFIRSGKETHTWSSSFGRSIDALTKGTTVMAVGYMGDVDLPANSRLAAAPLPQVDSAKPQTYGRYLAATVTKQVTDTKKAQQAWSLVSLFANPDITEQYATDTGTLPARADVAKRMSINPVYKAFVDQVGQAATWSKKEVSVADGSLEAAIDLVLQKNESPQIAVDVASKQYTSFLQEPSGIESDPAILSFWQSTDDTTNYQEVIRGYVGGQKEIKRIAISKRRPERYEWELLNAMAARVGPDLALLRNDSIARFAPTLRAFLPGSFNLSSGRLNDLVALERQFAPAVRTDMVVDGKIYGMPANLETLMLAMDQDQIDELITVRSQENNEQFFEVQELFTSGPQTWEDLQTMAPFAVERNGSNINLGFLGLGLGSNVTHADDILAVLIKQLGGELTDPDRLSAGIHLPISSQDSRVPGKEALDLLDTFTSPQSSAYMWNGSMPNSLESLASGKTMGAFIYPRDVAQLQQLNPKLNLKFFPLPQVDVDRNPVDIASYYALTLPLSGKKPNEAIGFIKYAVLESTSEGFVLPKLSNAETNLGEARSFGTSPQTIQRDTAQSYYKGAFPLEVNQVLIDVVDNKLTLEQGASKINQVLQRPVL